MCIRDRYCTAYPSSIAYQIEEVLPGAVAKQVRQVAALQGDVLNKTQAVICLLYTSEGRFGTCHLASRSATQPVPTIRAIRASRLPVVSPRSSPR